MIHALAINKPGSRCTDHREPYENSIPPEYKGCSRSSRRSQRSPVRLHPLIVPAYFLKNAERRR